MTSRFRDDDPDRAKIHADHLSAACFWIGMLLALVGMLLWAAWTEGAGCA